MPRDPHRRIRVENELQRAVSDLLRREVRDPRVGSITITAVKVSPDLRHAKLFYTPFDPKLDAQELQIGLDQAAKFMRGLIGRMLQLRVAPELVFKRDEQMIRGERLTALIDDAVAADRQRSTDSSDEPSG